MRGRRADPSYAANTRDEPRPESRIGGTLGPDADPRLRYIPFTNWSAAPFEDETMIANENARTSEDGAMSLSLRLPLLTDLLGRALTIV